LTTALGLGVVFVLAFAFSLCGWGWAVRRVLHLERGTWPATAALGMAGVVFLGGLLNLARLAHPWTLAIVVAAGVLLGVADLKGMAGLKGISFQFDSRRAIVFLIAAVIVGFAVQTQLPPKAYNFHDDYQKYFAHAARMIQTGTVYGSPLSAIGSETLGGQAFLQGFVVGFLPISYINGFDSVFAMFLCLMLACEFTSGRPGLQAMTVIAMLGVVTINPQYVNISSLYSGSAMVMALAVMVGDPLEFRKGSALPSCAATGLLCAALIALKTIFAPFVILVLLLLAVVLGVRWGVGAGLSLAAFLSPWLLLHAPHYVAAFRASRGFPIASGIGADPHVNLFSFDKLAYGSSSASYSMLVAAIGFSALLGWWAARKEDEQTVLSTRLMAAICAAGVATYFILVLVGPLQSGYAQAFRYYAPVAIGLAPAAFGMAARHTMASSRFKSNVPRVMVPAAIAVLSLLAFLPSLRDRVLQARTSGSILAFSWLANDPEYLAYNRQVLHGSTRAKVAGMLRTIPAGETVIAWIDAPFYLDYARNRIIDAEPAGLAMGWSAVPAARYLIWQYNGYATRSEADLIEQTRTEGALERLHATRTLEFLHRVQAWSERGEIFYDDGECKVIRLAD